MTGNIQHQVFYPDPPEVVWEYLTNSALIEQWLMKNDFQPVVGHDFHFWSRPMPDFNFDGTFYCKVLELVPHKKLIYSMKGGPGGGSITLDSLVTWTLSPKEGGTELNLLHSGFKEAAFKLFSAMD